MRILIKLMLRKRESMKAHLKLIRKKELKEEYQKI